MINSAPDTMNYLRSLPPIQFSSWENFLGAVLGSMVLILMFATVREASCAVLKLIGPWARLVEKYPSVNTYLAIGVSFAMAYQYGLDILAMLAPPRPVSILGVILTAAAIARGPEAVVDMARKLVRGAAEIKHEVDEAEKK